MVLRQLPASVALGWPAEAQWVFAAAVSLDAAAAASARHADSQLPPAALRLLAAAPPLPNLAWLPVHLAAGVGCW